MADTKISALASGAPLNTTDEIVLNQAGASKKGTLANVIAAVQASITAVGTIATGVWNGTKILGAYLNINGSADLVAPAVGDELFIGDITDANTVKKADVASIVNLADHDALTNYDAAEHFTLANITTTGIVAAGTWNGDVIDHERGGLEADVSAYAGLLHITGGATSAKTIGIADDNIVEIDDAGVADDEYAKFTANGLEGRAYADVKTDLSLNLVENTAVSTWAGTANITTLGTVTTGNVDQVLTKDVIIQCLAGDTDTAVADGIAYFTIPAALNGFNITAVHARVVTAGVTGTTDIQFHNVTSAADILSTKLTIDTTETGSDTAATPAVINAAEDDVATNDLIRVDVDAVSTTEAKGLIVRLTFVKP